MDNIRVAVRIRPFLKRESESSVFWKANQHTVGQSKGNKSFTFDRVFLETEETDVVFEEIAAPIIEAAMQGYDGTIFAYGQTASGKTYTMQGTQDVPGIIPTAMEEVFAAIEEMPDREFLLRVKYLELYNEALKDLLTDEKKSLNVREREGRVYVENVTEEVCTEPSQILALMKKGDARRHWGHTNMNEHSSRSHTIFCIIIESRFRSQKGKSLDGAVKVAHLNLVDLAGSERANETKAAGARLKEACNINQSLFALGSVINKLASGSDFVPFRDSKLTRILQSSLGGNAKTAIICTITAASQDQTLSTLQFAKMAKTIKNKPVVNEILSDDALMQRMKKEIQDLKKRLEGVSTEQPTTDPAPTALTEGEVTALLLQEREKVKAEMVKEMNEKMDNMKTMVVVSKSGATPKNRLKRKARRETWCPGATRKLALLSPPGFKMPKSPLSTSTLSLAPLPVLSTSSNLSFAPLPSLSSLSESDESETSLGSVSSSEFNEDNAKRFSSELMRRDSETLTSLDVDDSLKKTHKRRRQNVHFGEDVVFQIPEEQARDVGCQTEKPEEPESSERQNQDDSQTNDNTDLQTALTRENAELQAKLTQANADLQEALTKDGADVQAMLTSENDDLQVALAKENTELQEALTKAKADLQVVLTSSENAEVQAALARENAELQTALTKAKDDLQTVLTSNENDDVQAALAKENAELQIALTKAKDDLQTVLTSNENAEVQEALARENAELQAALTKANTDLQAALTRENPDLQAALIKENAELQAALTKANADLQAALTSENASLQAALTKESTELQAALTKENADLQAALTREKAELAEAVAIIHVLEEENKTVMTKLEQAQKGYPAEDSRLIAELREQVAELNFDLMRRSEEYAELQDFTRLEQSTVRDQEAQYKYEIERLHELIKLSEAESKELEESVSSRLAAAEKRASELEIALAKEKAELAKAVEVIHVLEDEKTASDEAKTIAELMTELDASKRKLSRKTDEFKMLEEFNQAERSKSEEFQKQEEKAASELEEAQVEIAALQASLLSEKSELEEAKALILALDEEKQRLEDAKDAETAGDSQKMAKLATELESVRSELEDKSDEISHLEQVIASGKLRLEELQEKEDLMMSEVVEAQKQNESLEKALAEEKNHVAKATVTMDALEEEKRQMESKMDEMRKARMAEESDKVSALATELESVRSELEDKSDEVSHLEQVIASGKLRLEELQEKEEKMITEVIETQKQNESLEKALAEEKNHVAKATVTMDALEEEKRQMESKMDEMRQARMAEESDKVSALATELESVRSELEDKSDEVSHLEQVIASGKLRLEELQEKEDRMMTEVIEAQKQNESLEKALAEEKNHVAKAMVTMDALEEEKRQMESKMDEMRQARMGEESDKVSALATELESVRSELEDKSDEVSHLEQVIASGKLRLEELQEKEDRMMSEVIEAQNQNESLEKALAEEKNHVAKATVTMDALEEEKRQMESKMDEMRQARMGEESDKVSALATELESVQSELEDKSDEVSHLEQVIASGKLRLEELQEKEDRMMSEVIEAQNQNESLEKALAEEKNHVAKATVTMDALEEEKRQMESKMDEMRQARMGEESDKVSALLSELDEMRRDTNEQTDKIARLEGFIAKGKAKLAMMQETEECQLKYIDDLEAKLEAAASDTRHQTALEELATKTSEVERLEQELQAATSNCERLRCLQEQKSSKEASLQRQIRELEVRGQAELTQMQEVCGARETRVAELETCVEELRRRLKEQEALSQGARSEAQLRETQEEMHSLRQEAAKFKNENEALQAAKIKVKEELLRVRKANSVQRSQLEERCRKVCLEMEAELEEEQAKVKVADEKLECQMKYMSDLEVRLEAAATDTRVDSLRAELAARNTHIDHLEKALNTSTSQNNDGASNARVLELEQTLEALRRRLETSEGATTEQLQAKGEELDQLKERVRDLKNSNETLEKTKSKMKEQMMTLRRNNMTYRSDMEAHCRKVCDEMEGELEEEQAKVKAAEVKLASQAKRICELECDLSTSQSGGSDTTALRSQLQARDQQIKRINTEHIRTTMKLEDRLKDLEAEKKDLDEKNREYRSELRREHQRNADSSVLSYANYPEAGVSGSGMAYDAILYSLKAENTTLKRDLKKTEAKKEKVDKSMETLKQQRDEQVTRNSKLKEELLYWRAKYEKVKGQREVTDTELMAERALRDANPPDASTSATSGAPTVAMSPSVSRGKSAWMLEAFKDDPMAEDRPECHTQ